MNQGRWWPTEIVPGVTRFGVIGCLVVSALTIGFAPLMLPGSYDWVRHTTSEAAAQGVDGAWITRAGFLFFAFAVIALSVRSPRHWNLASRLLHGTFGVCMIAVATFAHKPFEPGLPYDATEDLLHSIAATVTGFAFAIGVLVIAFSRCCPSRWRRLLDGVAVTAAIILPLGMSQSESYTGLLQRVMFGIAMAWYGIEAMRIGPIDESPEHAF